MLRRHRCSKPTNKQTKWIKSNWNEAKNKWFKEKLNDCFVVGIESTPISYIFVSRECVFFIIMCFFLLCSRFIILTTVQQISWNSRFYAKHSISTHALIVCSSVSLSVCVRMPFILLLLLLLPCDNCWCVGIWNHLIKITHSVIF